jgi:RNA polymerase sigma-70 factor (ECF subfamily)
MSSVIFSLKVFGPFGTFIAMDPEEGESGDAEIAGLLTRGEREAAFNRLFRAHWAKVVSLGFRLTRDPAEASDIAQDTFILVHRGLEGYRGEGRLVAWLMKIALHVGLKEQARRKRSRTVGMQALLQVPAQADRNATSDERLGQAMAALSDDQRAVLSLFAVEGLRHAEIAEALGVPEGTVWSRLHHARKRLQEVLGVDL